MYDNIGIDSPSERLRQRVIIIVGASVRIFHGRSFQTDEIRESLRGCLEIRRVPDLQPETIHRWHGVERKI
jgi:hypothetical protein